MANKWKACDCIFTSYVDLLLSGTLGRKRLYVKMFSVDYVFAGTAHIWDSLVGRDSKRVP